MQCGAVLMGSIGGDAKTSPWYKLEPFQTSGGRAFKDTQRAWTFLLIYGRQYSMKS